MIRNRGVERRSVGSVLLALLLAASVLVLAPAALAPAEAASATVVFDDMEHGDPFGNGWFFFDGSVGGGGIGANAADLPPSDGGAFSLETGWGSGAVPGFYGGFGRTSLTDLSGADHFNLWINPDAGQNYTLEINLQEDDNGDDVFAGGPDDEFQFNCVISVSGPCAIAGGGWQQVSIPLADFFDDEGVFPGGNGALDAIPAPAGNGQLINVVVVVVGNDDGAGASTDASFRTDYWAFSEGALNEPTLLVDDFESGLPTGIDGNGNPIGFFTFSDGSPISIVITDAPPAPVPGAAAGNNVLAMTGDVSSFAGFIHNFANAGVDTWVPQDWSSFEGMKFWFYGQNSGTTVFIDVIDNRNPGSTTDDAERFSVSFTDDFSGWQLLEFPFADFLRKEIGNGAPNDGFTLTQVHGWAVGTLATPGPVTHYVDDATLFGVAEIPELAVTFASASSDVAEGSTGNIVVKLNRPMNSDDPAQVSIDYFTEPGSATPDRDYIPTTGTLTFVNGGPSELSFPLATNDDSKWEGTETVILRLANPVDVAAGFALQSFASILDDEAFDPFLLDDFERSPYLWDSSDNVALSRAELAAGDPLARPEQDAYEGVLQVDGPIAVDIDVMGNVCGGRGVTPVALLSTADFDATTVDHSTVRFGDAGESHTRRGNATRHVEDANGDGLDDLVFHFRKDEIGYDCEGHIPFNGFTFEGRQVTAGGAVATLSRDFADGQDWSDGEALNFWFYGTNSGEVTVNVKDNRAVDPGPAGWSLAWADEFNEPAGSQPSPANWGYEIGDGSVNGIPGWGNDELQYYTDDPANVAMDGQGNLVITAEAADGSLDCYYGPCEYTSSRLVTTNRAEFAYGRIESRILVPDGAAGLWPAFWSLGTDIDVVSWPQTGEIDFMEYVSRLPNEIFGTIHGPGYSGGQSYGNVYDFGEPVSNDYHTFAIEWEPDSMKWYVDDILYHTAVPSDVAPNEWVFNDAVYFLLNLAIGGNFGGPLAEELTFPQEMKVDYVRVYQGPDTAERFEATFTDNFSGWQLVEVPFSAFSRSSDQPAGAPDDGLTLDEVWGYGFTLPDTGLRGGTTWIDYVQVKEIPPPIAVTADSVEDSGPGSLRAALGVIADGGTISFDAALAGSTIALTSGQLVVDKSVTIDASAAPGLSVSGNNASRVFQVNAGASVAINDLTIADGVGAPQGGGILNLGELSLERVTVTNNTESSGGGASFDLGGGGIYNGDGATLNLIDSTVSDNSTLGQPGGGIYGFFNSTLNISGSTISGNVAGDVAGGIRALGAVNMINSTVSGNTSTAWHGGGAFLTDGVSTITNSTIVGNNAPAGTTGGLFVGTFGAAPVTVTLANTIVADNGDFGCFLAFFGAGAVTLNADHNNLFTDATCNAGGSDLVVADAGVAGLADNGGPTLTHALAPGSPAIDAADALVCPATDQRGVARPQGGGCDVGAFEVQ